MTLKDLLRTTRIGVLYARTVVVADISAQRRPASEAQQLYRETDASIEKREKMAQARKMNALTMPHPDRRAKTVLLIAR